ncbi:rhodanese-related sulfurtransferase [Patescibacteria group bacterium]|nr:rhodanese-related sulfurtransferase [Patescibacteria group bacterium]
MDEYQIILFYNYTHVEDPEELRHFQHALCKRLDLKGRVIVAKEGINATLEGKTENINAYLEEYLADSRFSNTHIKKSKGIGDAFPKLSVRNRKEIVSLNLEEDFSPTEVTGKKLKPEELKQWFESGKDFHIVDMRNDYEYKVGRFKDSIMPKLENFRDVPRVLGELENLKNKPVLTVCTGGVRCEKASGFLKKNGFNDVYQLDGGIVSYMEKFPGEEFQGSLYVFDKRITMSFDPEDKHVVVGNCDICNVSSERYVNCKNPRCNKHFICCRECSEEDGKSTCSMECKLIMNTAELVSAK